MGLHKSKGSSKTFEGLTKYRVKKMYRASTIRKVKTILMTNSKSRAHWTLIVKTWILIVIF